MKDLIQKKLSKLKKDLSEGGEFFDIQKCLDDTIQIEKMYSIAKKEFIKNKSINEKRNKKIDNSGARKCHQ